MSVAVILSWYLAGAFAAVWMVDRGHSPVPWWVAAALLGALAWLVALPVARRWGRVVRWLAGAPDASAGSGVARVVVGVLDDEGAVSTAAPRVARPDDLVVGLRRVGFEAAGRLVDTGELDRAAAAVELAGRRCPDVVPRIGSGPFVDLVLEAAGTGGPSLVIRGPVRHGWQDLHRSIALGARAGCPVLHVPTAPSQPARAARRPVGSAA